MPCDTEGPRVRHIYLPELPQDLMAKAFYCQRQRETDPCPPPEKAKPEVGYV